METKNEIKFLEGPQSRWYDFKYTISVLFEFIKGFRGLHFIGPSVTIFGSARFKEGHKYYEQARALAGRIAKECFKFLDAPVEVLGALNLPAVPMNISLEKAMLPNADKVVAVLKTLLDY